MTNNLKIKENVSYKESTVTLKIKINLNKNISFSLISLLLCNNNKLGIIIYNTNIIVIVNELSLFPYLTKVSLAPPCTRDKVSILSKNELENNNELILNK